MQDLEAWRRDYSLTEEKRRIRSHPRVIKNPLAQFEKGHPGSVGPSNSGLRTVDASWEVLPPGGRSSKHGHQNDAIFYILEGKGYDIHDGERFDWEAGDVCIVPPGCVHQHFNASDTQRAVALVIRGKPLYLNINLMEQKQVEPPWSPQGS
ncbi:MAG: cupin domain-containing protein [Chloroflexi bacterium]|nr:cupin domain-containing protein [Chloroflexota bacterium]